MVGKLKTLFDVFETLGAKESVGQLERIAKEAAEQTGKNYDEILNGISKSTDGIGPSGTSIDDYKNAFKNIVDDYSKVLDTENRYGSPEIYMSDRDIIARTEAINRSSHSGTMEARKHPDEISVKRKKVSEVLAQTEEDIARGKVNEARNSGNFQPPAILEQDVIAKTKEQARMNYEIETNMLADGNTPIRDKNGNIVGFNRGKWSERNSNKREGRRRQYNETQQAKHNAEFERYKNMANSKIYGNNTNASQVAQNISKTAPLDNSGGFPTWGKVGVGIAGGLIVGSVLSRDD